MVERVLPAARAGDVTAVALVLAYIRPHVVHSARWWFRAARGGLADDLAEDVAQETLWSLWRGLPSCRAATRWEFHAWADVVARRIARRLRRDPGNSNLAAALGVADEDDALVLLHGDLLEQHPALEPDLDEFRRLRYALLEEAFSDLRDGGAECIWDHVVEGASWAEVAERLATTPAAAKRRFQRACGAVRRTVPATPQA